jgi:hypothetical protein
MSKGTSETISINSTLTEFECEAINYALPGIHVPARANHKRTEKHSGRRKPTRRKKRRR